MKRKCRQYSEPKAIVVEVRTQSGMLLASLDNNGFESFDTNDGAWTEATPEIPEGGVL